MRLVYMTVRIYWLKNINRAQTSCHVRKVSKRLYKNFVSLRFGHASLQRSSRTIFLSSFTQKTRSCPPPFHANCLPMRWTICVCLCQNPSKIHSLGKNSRTNKAAVVEGRQSQYGFSYVKVICVYWRDLTNLNCRSGALSSSSLHLSLESLRTAIKCTLAWDS